MGFLKYLGKEFKHSVVSWWHSDGLAKLTAYALVFGVALVISALVISAIVIAPEHIQKTIIIIILLIIMVLFA